MTANKGTTIQQVKAWGALSPENELMCSLCFDRLPNGVTDSSALSELGERRCNTVVSALNAVIGLQTKGCQVVYDLYSPEEIAADPGKGEAKLMFFPGEADKPFVIVMPGGGYQMVAVLDEGIQDAVEFNRLGYSAVVLIYRVGVNNIMPRPLEDLSRAIALISSGGEELPCDKSKYLLAGFSSGGHLAAMWCSLEHGYRRYGHQAPEAVFAAYPLVSLSQRKLMYDNRLGGLGELSHVEGDLRILCGDENAAAEEIACYDTDKKVDASWPPFYLIHGYEDGAVYYSNSQMLSDALTAHKVPHVLRFVKQAGHAFSTGRGTEAEGWFADAIEFYNEVKKR